MPEKMENKNTQQRRRRKRITKNNGDKSKPIFGLDKIPEVELLRYSRIECGQLKSYIQELEYELEQRNKEIESLKDKIKKFEGRKGSK